MARPLTVVPATDINAVSEALTNALAGSSTLCVIPDAPGSPVLDWSQVLHLNEPVPTQVAVVVATSGSTGHPRGVMLTAAALLSSAHAAMRRLDGPGAWVLALPVSSVGGLQVLIRSAMTGLDPVSLDPTTGFHVDEFASAAADLSSGLPHYTSLVPAQLRRIVAAGGAALDALAGFDTVLVGGAGLDAELRASATAAGVRIVSTYGMTETSGGCVYDGVPLPGVHVIASGTGLRIGGEVVALGYHGDPGATRESFVDTWFLTRDIGYVDDDGVVSVTGRVDDVIISGGVNVATGAVEEALRRHPAIDDAAVLGRPDAEWGQAVVALVVPIFGASLDLADIRTHVSARLGAAAAPRALIIVPALPRLHSGKLDRVNAQRLVLGSAREQPP